MEVSQKNRYESHGSPIYVKFFWLALVTSIFQIWLSGIKAINLSFFIISTLPIFPLILLKNYRVILRNKELKVLAALLGTQVISIIWSPDKLFAIKYIALSIPVFLVVVVSVYFSYMYNKNILLTIMRINVILIALHGVVIAIFRVSPDIESAFLNSTLAQVFINNVDLFELINNISQNNVLDPLKSGGVFINANIAALYQGLGAILAWYVSNYKNRFLYRALAVAIWVSVFFAGSKSAIIAALVIPCLGMYFSGAKGGTKQRAIYVALFVFAILIILFSLYINTDFLKAGAFGDQVESTSIIRFLIWGFFIKSIVVHPIIGLGFGGWQLEFPNYAFTVGLSEGFPPHNTFIYLWSQSGIFAVILAGTYMYYVLKMAKNLMNEKDAMKAKLGVAIYLAFIWHFYAGMGENLGLIGDPRVMTILGLLLGIGLCERNETITR